MTDLVRALIVVAWACLVLPARAALGLAELPGDPVSGPVTVFYPTAGVERPVRRDRFEFDAAVDALARALVAEQGG